MSQPCNRSATVPAPDDLDPALNEFWVSNPWQIVAHGHNLSCYERNRVFLNVAGQDFVEVSHLTGADSDGDGRAVVAADFRNAGRMDLLVRQVGGGPLLLFENRLPAKNYLTVSLRGRTSNRRGIGARLTADVGGRRLVRELYPANGYMSQGPTAVHFGLGEVGQIDRLTIRWPSGKVQVLQELAGGRHVVIDEGKDGPAAIERVVFGQTVVP